MNTTKLDSKLVKRLDKKQTAVLIKSVRENREVPIRFVYLGEYWDKIAKDQDYNLKNREIGVLKKYIEKVAQNITKKVNIIHLGVGNGIEIPIIAGALKDKIDTYAIADINETMLKLAGNRVAEFFSKEKIRRFNQDFETYSVKRIFKETKKAGAKTNLIVLAANGVLFSNDDFVKDIFSGMDKNDYFFLTLELYQPGKDKEIIQPYLIPSVLDLLSNGVKILGYRPKYEDFSAEIDKKKHLLKVYFSPGNKNKLLVLHSYKPNMKQLTQRMERFGFKKIFTQEHRPIHTCAALYRK